MRYENSCGFFVVVFVFVLSDQWFIQEGKAHTECLSAIPTPAIWPTLCLAPIGGGGEERRDDPTFAVHVWSPLQDLGPGTCSMKIGEEEDFCLGTVCMAPL